MYTIKNCYYKNSKLAEDKFEQLVKHFASDLSASDTAREIGISVRSVNDIFLKIREKIAKKCEGKQSAFEKRDGHFFVEQKVINRHRINGSICKLTGYLYAEALQDEITSSDRILNKIKAVKSAELSSFNNSIISQEQCLTDMALFWAYSHERLKKFKGIPKNTLLLHLKETEFRFNSRHLDLYSILLEMIASDPI